MIYIILSNVGMAVMMILVYLRYSHFRISSTSEIKTLRKKLDEQSEALHSADEKLVNETRADSQKVQNLLSEIDELRKEKENEIKLRLNAEKQIGITLQKMHDLESRMEDWKVMQDAVMRDSKDAIIKVGNELYKKLNDSYKQEVETNKNLIGRISKTVTDLFEGAKTSVASTATPTAKSTPEEEPKHEIHAAVSSVTSKKLIADLIETMKASGHLANKDYFLSANFDEAKAKLMLCELAFVSKDTLHIIDFKSCHYLAEFGHSKNELDLKQKLDRYFVYLNDPKYRASIHKVMATTKAKFTKTVTIIALPSKAELQALREIHYLDKAQKLGFEVLDIDGLNNVVI